MLDGEEAVRVVSNLRGGAVLEGGQRRPPAAPELVARALRLGSGDNVTALVVEFAAAG